MSKEFKSYLVIVFSALIFAILILQFFSFYLVSGDSMAPTLKNNNYLIVKKGFLRENDYKKGDIIIFQTAVKSSLKNEKDLVKRIIAVEGDEVKIENNHVYINENLIQENYLKNDITLGTLKIKVDKGNYFVMGDNREISLDSRQDSIGLVNQNQILGKVIVKMFPFEKIGDESYEY